MRVFVLSVLITLATTVAHADVRINDDPGGDLGAYLLKFSEWRASGKHVVIDGRCLSACTLVLGLLPPQRICVTPRAVLGFHATRASGLFGTTPSGWSTQTLLQMYPVPVRRWIAGHGGLTEQMIYLAGGQLTAMYRSCH
jgi:hypothetical protein